MGRYEATIEVAEQTADSITFAVKQTKGKPISMWVTCVCMESGNPQAVEASSLPVIGEENGGVGTAGPFEISGDTGKAHVWDHDGKPFDEIGAITFDV